MMLFYIFGFLYIFNQIWELLDHNLLSIHLQLMTNQQLLLHKTMQILLLLLQGV